MHLFVNVNHVLKFCKCVVLSYSYLASFIEVGCRRGKVRIFGDPVWQLFIDTKACVTIKRVQPATVMHNKAKMCIKMFVYILIHNIFIIDNGKMMQIHFLIPIHTSNNVECFKVEGCFDGVCCFYTVLFLVTI